MSSLLVDINYAKPDPMLLAAALAATTIGIRFMVAVRSGLLSPTLFAQQVNTFSQVANGRICLNVVAGYSPEEQRYYGDFLPHDERYARTAEFLQICHRLWDGEAVSIDGKYFSTKEARINTRFSGEADRPEIFIGGNSEAARQLAIDHGSCWMRMADSPGVVEQSIGSVRESGKEAGLRLSIICAPTREEALQKARDLVATVNGNGAKNESAEKSFVRGTDSQSIQSAWQLAESEWLTPFLWTGAVRTHGAPSIALVGDPDEVASALVKYGRIGISQFILSGWPKEEAMIYFGQQVLPRVRALEAQLG